MLVLVVQEKEDLGIMSPADTACTKRKTSAYRKD